jgi:hypothetical protein
VKSYFKAAAVYDYLFLPFTYVGEKKSPWHKPRRGGLNFQQKQYDSTCIRINNQSTQITAMTHKTGAIVFFLIAVVGIFALVRFTNEPSAYIVQPTEQVLGYCPVSQANDVCMVGGRVGICECKTLDSYLPQYSQRDNCHCVIPIYGQPIWPNP